MEMGYSLGDAFEDKNKAGIEHSAAMPTRVNTARASKVVAPPQIHATAFMSKRPIKPQLMPPTMMSKRQIL